MDAPVDALIDARVRLQLLTREHADHRLTVNLYLNPSGVGDARVWCGTCQRTLRGTNRSPAQAGEEVVLGVG